MPVRRDNRAIALLSFGHAAADTCQGAVPALLPFLIARRGLSIAQASALVLAATVASSVIQPVFGHLADRRSMSWLMPSGLVLAGAGVAATGLTHGYPATFAAIVVSGVGVAAFHPEASRLVKHLSGARKASAMSLFSVGGNVGFAIGPPIATALVLGLGLDGTAGLVALPLLAAAAVAAGLARVRSGAAAGASAGAGERAGSDRWGAFARLGCAVAVRSVIYFGLMTFVPLYFVRDLGQSKAAANTALTVMLAAGALGTLVGGRVADRVGARTVFIGSMALVVPLMWAFLAAGPVLATVALAAIGFATIATFSVTVVIGQDLLPSHAGVASGVTLGLAIGVGGVGASVLGAIADANGIHTVLDIVAVLPAAALGLAFTLPGGSSRAHAPGSRRPHAAAGGQPHAADRTAQLASSAAPAGPAARPG